MTTGEHRCSRCQGLIVKDEQGLRAIVRIRQFGKEEDVEVWFHKEATDLGSLKVRCDVELWARSLGKRFVRWVERSWA